jgi:hypothetical protein
MSARALTGALLVFAMLVGGIGVTVALIAGNNKPPPPTATSTQPPLPTAPPKPSVPTVVEFTIPVTVTAQKCAGEGCVYTYTVQPKYIGLHPLPPTEFTVVYQVTGGHQPQEGKFTVKGEQARIFKDVTVEGPPGAQLQAKPTQVIG